jgi:hypothetical protein
MTTPLPKNHMYLRTEIRDMVTAIALAHTTTVRAAGTVSPDYTAGYMDALTAVLATFGIELPSQLQRGEVRP